jgi:hypothetical protein
MATIAVPSQLASGEPAAPPASRTLHQYRQTLIWTGLAILVCVIGYVIEKYVFRDALGLITDVRYRFFKNPAEVPMRLFGIPHILIGTLFLFSSPRIKKPGGAYWLIGLTALGITFCWLFYTFGRVVGEDGDYEYASGALLLFYFYFLIHGFRDEAFFYRAYGEMPKEERETHDRIMVVLQALMLGLLVSLAIPGYVLFGEFYPKFKDPLLSQMFPASWPYVLRFASTFVPMVLIAVFALRRIARRFPDGLHGLWRTHRPILTVFMVSTGIILIALCSGPWTFNFVVLMHFVAWYLFGRYSLGSRPPQTPVKGWWEWMRRTKTGFTVLHLGLAAIVVVLAGVETWVFGKQSPMEAIIGSKSFFYWTIMHVTLSFYPR